jgi:hypothetical protein
MRVMRRLVPVALLALICSALPSGADPLHLPTDASGWATPNVTPLAHIATAGAGVSGAFYDKQTFVLSVADEVWNYTSVNPAPVTGGVQVYDTSDPADPRLEGFLPLPHQQNEDLSVSAARRVAIVSQDWLGLPGRLYVVDMTDPTAPSLRSVLVYPDSYGHTATLVDHDRYLWVSGGEDVLVVDLRDLDNPVVAGTFATPAGRQGASGAGVHDAEVDRYGDITVYGSGGTAVHRLTGDPVKPRLVASISAKDNTKVRNGLIHHGGKRLDRDTWLLTEEDYDEGCGDDGAFEVWRIDRAAKRLRFVSTWDAPKGADADRGALEQTQYCSSHWFTVNSNDVVADGWYGAGVRFLDLSDPRHPRPIGIWAGDSTTASQAIFAPGRDDIVYVPDYVRGLDVIKLARGGKGAKTVTDAQTKRVGSSTVPGLSLRFRLTPDRRWGFTCLVVSPAHHG